MGERKPCTFEGCERARASRLYCQSHWKQFKKYGEVWTLGDKARERANKQAVWTRLSAAEQATRLEPMLAAQRGKPRSPEHAKHLSDSLRARWQAGGPNMPRRICRGCEEEFQPNSNHHWYCGEDCQAARRRLRQRYGLTNRQYLDMLEAQNNVCALCGTVGRGFNGSRYALVVDHCHDTGSPRGLLCPDCNTALGRFGDDAMRLRAAADYIDRTCPH